MSSNGDGAWITVAVKMVINGQLIQYIFEIEFIELL